VEFIYNALENGVSAKGIEEFRSTLLGVLECANAWEPEARLLGNIRAIDIVTAISGLLNVVGIRETGDGLTVRCVQCGSTWTPRVSDRDKPCGNCPKPHFAGETFDEAEDGARLRGHQEAVRRTMVANREWRTADQIARDAGIDQRADVKRRIRQLRASGFLVDRRRTARRGVWEYRFSLNR
jgi:hypothetical protein